MMGIYDLSNVKPEIDGLRKSSVKDQLRSKESMNRIEIRGLFIPYLRTRKHF